MTSVSQGISDIKLAIFTRVILQIGVFSYFLQLNICLTAVKLAECSP
jgi:hypothetical protein